MESYPSYKDSGVEWIGGIPKKWNLISLKHLVSTKITDGPHETPEFVDEGIPFLSVESVQDNKLDFNRKRGFITEETHKEYSKKCKPQRDDVFLVKSGSTTGKSTIVETDEEFNIWSPLCIIRSDKSKVTPRFTFTSLQSFYFRRFVELGWSFGTQPNIGMGVIENIRIIVPPLSEQKQIVSFLYTKTQKIDELIDKTEKKIELLKEKRISLINHCLTKGLNPNVEMKDSGVEWIGEIPRDWNLISLKHLVSTKITDGPHETPEFVDEGIPFLSVESVHDNKLDFNRKRGFITEETHKEYSKKCKPQRDDVFLVKSGSTTGKSTIVETDEEFNIWSPLCIIRSDKSKVTPRFTFTSLQSFYFRRFVELGWSFGTQPNIGMGVIENIRIIVPPISKQTEIVEYLDEKNQKIDSTIEKETQRIELLKEYRQSLISEVVTGKIDVRD